MNGYLIPANAKKGTLIFNIFIVVLSGYIPTKVASKKKIVDCIYGRF